MAWISVHESVDGPKLRKLYKQLGCSKFEALGILNFLWFWGLMNAEKDGLILYADKSDIERYLYGAGSGCKLDAGKVVDALFDSGWLDWSPLGICIHDWVMWQDQWYKAKEAREKDAKRKRESRRSRPSDQEEQAPMNGKADGPLDSPTDSPVDSTQKDAGEDREGDVPQEEQQKPKPEPAKYTPDFEVFWDAYPRKADKGMAYKKYKARLNDGYSPAELLEAARNYAIQCRRQNTEKQYIKHPKTFLGDSTPFLDYLPKPKAPPLEPGGPGDSNPFAEYKEDE